MSYKIIAYLLVFFTCFAKVSLSQEIQTGGTWTKPWWIPVKEFNQVKTGEHPRLLFRKSDLPELRKKAQTPEGKAILNHLRKMLDGANGDQMPVAYSTATNAYTLGKFKQSVVDTIGAYTFGHVAGYGLLYQLTGDKQYAELGRKCFEQALEGQRDRDDRYSWVNPGGALRAGVVLGWYAVGYDMCYDGWDEATREKFGKAIENYWDVQRSENDKTVINLEFLVSSTMPPISNHFGMQVGGAALALMVINGESWVNQVRVDNLLEISKVSMVRNVTEGFGDGGFYIEGDGTGSMASFIVYLTAIQAWKNAMGIDFVNTGRPNIPMTVLKWFYLTIVRNGEPDFWPIRGAYPHNVWDNKLSGGGYFGIGFGILTKEQKSAVKWYYNHFMLENDLKSGTPYESSVYPQISVAAFVNWPVHMEEQNPAEMLPSCYRDSKHSFYAWRNRWRDENDIVISVLTKPAKGYHGSKADTAIHIVAFGKKMTWGKAKGNTRNWQVNDNGTTSVLTLEDGTSLAVDFSGLSGADAMLVTTGEAEGKHVQIGNDSLTFKFLTANKTPEPKVKKNMVIVGDQKITVKDGEIVFFGE